MKGLYTYSVLQYSYSLLGMYTPWLAYIHFDSWHDKRNELEGNENWRKKYVLGKQVILFNLTRIVIVWIEFEVMQIILYKFSWLADSGGKE